LLPELVACLMSEFALEVVKADPARETNPWTADLVQRLLVKWSTAISALRVSAFAE
jgi:hypothetical protein